MIADVFTLASRRLTSFKPVVGASATLSSLFLTPPTKWLAMCLAAIALMKAGNLVMALQCAKAAIRVFAFSLSGEGLGGLTHLTGGGRGIVGSLAGIVGIILAGNAITDIFFKQFISYIQCAIIDARCGWDTTAAPAVGAAFAYTMLLMGALLAMDYESSDH